ncbi:MAG: alpha/beta hydrolase fold domain-containing protein [Clostridia bacterium]|nr:alpha/beta hydrolase fold domain-containing protein [Clostridia bacterium]
MKKKNGLLRSQLQLLKPFISNCSLSVARRGQDRIGRLMALPHKGDCEVQDITVGDIPCAMVTPKNELSDGVIIYLHGGGYVAGNLSYAKGFATVLAVKCGIKVFTVAYRLAPEHVFPAAVSDTLEAYGYLLSNGYDPSKIIIAGESAGGGLCYSLCRKLREKGRTLPAGIVAISPWTDLTLSGSSFATNEKVDPSMTKSRLKYFADCYAYGAHPEGKKLIPNVNQNEEEDRTVKSDPLMSPLFDSLEKMPPSLIFVGSDEIMLDDSVKLHGKLLEAGAESTLEVKADMWHGYLLYGIKENEVDFDRIRKFIKQRIPHHRRLRWVTLDNAAKIFPAARNRNWSNVFRLSATMKEPIDRELMQTALDVTVRRFPTIAVRVKTGFFWYYLEEVPKAPKLMDEKPYPLSRMPRSDFSKCAFRAIINDKRIAVEFFHALTDGNGGLVFLKTLVSEYIFQKYGEKVPIGNGVLDRLEEPLEEEFEDSFLKYAGEHAASRADTDAYRIKGRREEDGFRTNTTFILDADAVVREAKKRGITVTAYLSAALTVAAANLQYKTEPKVKNHKPIKVLIPVNLRKIFKSGTLRNFVLYATTSIDTKLGKYEFDEICDIISHQMKLQITEKNMAAMIATNVNDEKSRALRVVPLFLKNIVMKMVFNAVGERKSCFSFSNLGVVDLPEEFTSHVERLDFVLSSQASSPYNVSAITYGGKVYLNIIRNIAEPIFEAELYRALRELDIPHEVESNTRNKKSAHKSQRH